MSQFKHVAGDSLSDMVVQLDSPIFFGRRIRNRKRLYNTTPAAKHGYGIEADVRH